ARSEGIAQEILEDDADVAAKIGGGELADVDAVDGDGALFGLVEARHQLDDGGLARPVLTDKRDGFARLDGEVEVADDEALRARIAEADVVEDDSLPQRHGEGPGVLRLGDGRLDIEERVEIVEIERLPGDPREADEDPLEEAVELAERA